MPSINHSFFFCFKLCAARYSVSTKSYLEVTELDRFMASMKSLLGAPVLQNQDKVVQLIQELNNVSTNYERHVLINSVIDRYIYLALNAQRFIKFA
jgi:hypothetical protein